MTAPTLISQRLVLRPVETGDHAALCAMRADARVGQFTGGTRTPQEVWFTLLRSSGMWTLLGYGYWTLCERRSGQIVGEIGFADFQRGLTPDISGDPEAGWIIAPDAWGQGYGHEAVRAAHDWLDSARPGRSTCIISPENTASLKIAAHLGYQQIAATTIKDEPIIVFERYAAGASKGLAAQPEARYLA